MAAAPPPVPGDDKDWTWVLERPCPECGFDAGSYDARAVGAGLRANTQEWVELLSGDDAALRSRPEPGVWSALEYACHVRDVCRIYHQRLTLMLTTDGPHYPNWDQDATAVEGRYDLADPVAVASELAADAEQLAALLDTVGDDDWPRTGHRSDGAAFTVDTFARYLLHDPIHHLWDVRRPT